MEATIDELVDNLIKEKHLDGKEADEITEALELASKHIEPSRLSGFVKSVREKIDAPASEIFTQNGLNINELKNVAEVIANVVIKEQVKDSEKNKNNNVSEYTQDATNNPEQNIEEKDDNQLIEEEMLRDCEGFLERTRPGLDGTTKKRLAQSIYNTQKTIIKNIERMNNGESPENLRKEMLEDYGGGRLASSETLLNRDILLVIEKAQNDSEQQNIQGDSNNGNIQPQIQIQPQSLPQQQAQQQTTSPLILPFDIAKFLPENIRNMLKWTANGKVTAESLEEVQHVNNVALIEGLRRDIVSLEQDIEDLSSKNWYEGGLLDKYKDLEKVRMQLRDTLRLEEAYREKHGEKSAVENERSERKSFLDIAKKRYFSKDNKESIVEIFEKMKEEATSKGINFEEIIGFDDILESVLEEMNKYPEQVNNAGTIEMREKENYRNQRELKILEIIKGNAEKKRKEELIAGDKSKAKYYDDLAIKYTKRRKKLFSISESNAEKNKGIKNRVTETKEQIEFDDEIIRNAATVDTEQMGNIQNATEFMTYATNLYFTSNRNVSEIYEEFKEKCTSMGISVEDLIDAVSEETRNSNTSANYLTIKEFETKMRKISLEISELEKASRNASQNGEKKLVARNNQKIAKLKSELETKRETNSYIKRTIVLRNSREERINQREKAAQGKTSDVSTDLRQEGSTEPKKKNSFLSFVKNIGKKFKITPKEVNGEVAEISDLQKVELEEAKTQPKAIKDNKTNSSIEVSTINVGGEEPTVETEAPNVGDDDQR